MTPREPDTLGWDETMPERYVLVRVAPELLAQMASADSEPVVIVGIDEQADGTFVMNLRRVVSSG